MSRSIVQADILLRLLRSGNTTRAARVISHLHPADIARLFGQVRPAEARALLDILFKSHRAGSTISELPAELIPQFLDLVDDSRLTQMLLRMPPDDGIVFLESLESERCARILRGFDVTRRKELEKLLRYPPETAGNVMTTRFLALLGSVTAQEAIDIIRTQGSDVESIFYLYVVDEQQILEGVVALRRLVSAPPETLLSELMIPDPISCAAMADQEEVAQHVARYNLLAIPLLDERRRLVGIITVDDAIDVLQEEATQDMYHLAGLDEEDRVFSPISVSVRKRLPWTSLNLATAFMAASVVAMFEATIAQKVALATFMPIVAGLGGNMGSQTLTVITRGIALGEFEFARAKGLILKNITIGLIVGAVAGSITALLAYLWRSDPMLGLVLFLAMVANMSIAGLMGSLVPVLLKRLKQDPAMGGSVLITASTDTLGFLIFLSIAKVLLGL